MRYLRALIATFVLLTMATAATAQINFTRPQSPPVRFQPLVFKRLQWTRLQSQPVRVPAQRYSVIRVQPMRFQRIQTDLQQTRYRNEVIAPLRFRGTHRTADAPAPAKVTPVQSARAARASLTRFSQGLDSLK